MKHVHKANSAYTDNYLTLSGQELSRMRNDLLHTGTAYLMLSMIILLLLASEWYQSQTMLTLIAMYIGGAFGLVLPWIGIRQAKLLGFHIKVPEHLTSYDHKLQAVIWKLQNKYILLAALPYFIYLLYLEVNMDLPFGVSIENSIVALLLATACLFGFGMGLLSWQIYWSLDREIRKHEKKSKA